MASFLNGTARQIWDPDNTIGTDTTAAPQTLSAATPLENEITPGSMPTSRQLAATPVSRYVNPSTGEMTPEGMERARQAEATTSAMGGTFGAFKAEPVTSGLADAVKGFTNYHGSPHTFPPTEANPLGEFRDTAIGSGEGNQSYGVGHYTADAEPTAETYLQNAQWSYGGRKAQAIYDKLYDQSMERGLDNAGWSKLNAQRQFWESVVLGRSPRQIIADAQANPDEFGQNFLDYVSKLNPDRFRRVGGNMYEVNIKASPESYLRWDRPVPADHPIRDLLFDASAEHVNSVYADTRNIGKDARFSARDENISGGVAYKQLANLLGGDAEASAALRDAGVPGIRYLDAGSRQAGEGTYNHVTFSPATLEVIRRYGLAGLMAGGAGAAGVAGSPSQAQAGELADHLDRMKTYAPDQYKKLVTSPAVAAAANSNIEKLIKYGSLDTARPEYVRMLNNVSGGRLEGILRHMLGQEVE